MFNSLFYFIIYFFILIVFLQYSYHRLGFSNIWNLLNCDLLIQFISCIIILLLLCHSGAVEGPEWDAPSHGTMHSGSGSEETEFSGGGGEGGHHQGFQRLWAPPGDGDLLQIPRAGDLGD